MCWLKYNTVDRMYKNLYYSERFNDCRPTSSIISRFDLKGKDKMVQGFFFSTTAKNTTNDYIKTGKLFLERKHLSYIHKDY